MSEHVLVIGISGLADMAETIPAADMDHRTVMDTLLTLDAVSFIPRRIAEESPHLRQLVPYIIVRHGEKVLSYERDTKGKESRLHGRRSIGWGGHVELQDVRLCDKYLDVNATVRACADREIYEELGLTRPIRCGYLGLIAERGDEVSAVHLGCVEIWDFLCVPSMRLDASCTAVEWVSLPEVESAVEQLESWSRIALRMLQHRNLSGFRRG